MISTGQHILLWIREHTNLKKAEREARWFICLMRAKFMAPNISAFELATIFMDGHSPMSFPQMDEFLATWRQSRMIDYWETHYKAFQAPFIEDLSAADRQFINAKIDQELKGLLFAHFWTPTSSVSV